MLVVLMVIGSLALWLAIPAAWILAAGRIGDGHEAAYLVALIGCPVTMALWALVLAKLHSLYLGSSERRARHSGWLEPLGRDPGPTGPAPVLDLILAATVLVAIVALAAWFFFFASSFNPTYAPPR